MQALASACTLGAWAQKTDTLAGMEWTTINDDKAATNVDIAEL